MSRALLSFGLLVACAGPPATPSDDPEDSAPTLDLPLAGACAQEIDYGGFVIDANADYAYVTGQVLDGVVPLTLRTLTQREGECGLFKKENPYCEPGCDPGYTCDFDGSCIPYPAAVDLGGVRVEGLLVEVALSPVTPGYTYFDTSVPNPPFDPGDLIHLHTEGGAFSAVDVYGYGVDALEADSLSWLVSPGAPLALRWEPPTSGAPSEVRLTLQIDQHGITPLTAVCEFDDDGEGAVPAALIDALFSQGVSGFPNGSFTRRTVDSASVGEGCMDLTVSSSLVPDIDVDGYTPCTSDADCPDGQICDLTLEICE